MVLVGQLGRGVPPTNPTTATVYLQTQGQDVTGAYPLAGGQSAVGQGERYSVFSLWDTYRATHPLLTIVAALVGGGFSIRQLWLQSLPADQVPACGPSVDYILENFPLSKALEMLLRGDGNCAEVLWTFLGISIPGWTLVAFAMIIVGSLYVASRGITGRSPKAA